MSEIKKISSLGSISTINLTDEFVIVDKSVTSGNNAGSLGKTEKLTFDTFVKDLNGTVLPGEKGNAGSVGQSGQSGNTGPAGPAGQIGQTGPDGVKGIKGIKGSSRATNSSPILAWAAASLSWAEAVSICLAASSPIVAAAASSIDIPCSLNLLYSS